MMVEEQSKAVKQLALESGFVVRIGTFRERSL